MSARRSIVGSVTRAHALSLLLSGVLTAVVAGAAAVSVLLSQDDDAALALAKTLGSELADHRDESEAELAELIRHEQVEQRWFHRDVEVWVDAGHRLGGQGSRGHLAAWSNWPEGCQSEHPGGRWSRVCVAHVARSPATVVVASPISAVVRASVPIVLGVCFAAFLSAALLAMVGRWALLAALAPLARFTESLGTHDGSPTSGLSTLEWGAEEIDQLAVAFQGLLDRVATVFEHQQRFAANAAHELRTPLTRLRGQIELAAAELADRGSVNARLTLAVRSCEELTRSMEALLALSRETTDTTEAVDLGEIARRVQQQPQQVAVVGQAPVIVRGDRDLLLLAARNLVDNALKYAGGDVRIVVHGVGGMGELGVEDDGPGIPESELSRVREPFARGTRETSDVRGSGLGLALVDHVARLHGGRLDLRPRMPRGLAAVLVLPLRDTGQSTPSG